MISHLAIALLTLHTAGGNTFYQDNNFIPEGNVEKRKVFSPVDQNITLTCTNPSPWFFCVWEGPRGDRVCGLRDKLGAGQSGLCGEEERFTITGQFRSEKSSRADWRVFSFYHQL